MSKTVRERGKDRRRRRILDAAKLILAEEGLEGLTTRKLADRADVSVATLYNVLGSKEEIIKAVLLELQQVTHEAINRIEHKSPVERIVGFADALCEVLSIDSGKIDQPLQRALLLIGYQQKFSPEIVKATAIDSMTLLEQSIAEAQEKGLILDTLHGPFIADQIFRTINASIRDYLLNRLTESQLRAVMIYNIWLILASVASRKTRAKYLRMLTEEDQHMKNSGLHSAYKPD